MPSLPIIGMSQAGNRGTVGNSGPLVHAPMLEGPVVSAILLPRKKHVELLIAFKDFHLSKTAFKGLPAKMEA